MTDFRDEHDPELHVGSVYNVVFDAPYLKADLTVLTAEAIAAIESGVRVWGAGGGGSEGHYDVETFTGADLDRLASRYGFGRHRPARFPGESDAEFRERVLDVVWGRVPNITIVQPKDPRSAILARAIAADKPFDPLRGL